MPGFEVPTLDGGEPPGIASAGSVGATHTVDSYSSSPSGTEQTNATSLPSGERAGSLTPTSSR